MSNAPPTRCDGTRRSSRRTWGGSLAAIERSGRGGAPHPPARDDGRVAIVERSLIQLVPGLGTAREAALLAAFGSIGGLRHARTDELLAVRGIGP